MIVIKKYPNRRLYNTQTSSYVNLDAIRELVKNREEFQVIDSKTEQNLTKSILLQIITESEANENQSVMTEALLKQLIRFYDTNLQLPLQTYLEHSLVTFIEQQDQLQQVMNRIVEANPMTTFSKLMEQSFKTWPPKKDS